MDSGATEDSTDGLNLRGRVRWTENCKVYTRRIHRKPNKTSNNYDSITASAAAGTSENPTTTTAPATVSSAAVATPATADVFAPSTSEDPEVSSAPPANNGIHATSSRGTTGDDVLQEPPEALVADDAGSWEQNVREESVGGGQASDSVDKSADFPHQLEQIQEQLRDGEQIPSLSKNNDSTAHRVWQSSWSQNAELENLQDSNEARNLKRPSPHHSPDEILQTRDGGAQNLRDSSPLSGKNGMPNRREDPAAQLPIGNELQNNGDLMPVPPQVPSGNDPANVNGVMPLEISKINDKVIIKLTKSASKNAILELRNNLDCEVNQVRRVVEQLEAKELQLASNTTQISNSNPSDSSNYIGNGEGGNIGGHSFLQPQHVRNDLVDRRVLVRIRSEMGTMGHQEIRPMGLTRVNSDMGTARSLQPRPYRRQLSVSVMGNNHRAGEFVEKEKRTPKANKYYRNSEFLLGKDRLPPENVKRLKTNNGLKHSGQMEHAFRFGFALDKIMNQVFKSCNNLLQRLMKHKHGWVFNEPVNAKALGLVDYHDIIKHPMDLGTIKTRLSQNWYKTPREFAEDVRLVFRNAMTYNPKGQDVHIMAEELLQIFEEKWAAIEAEYSPHWKYQMYQDAGLRTPTSRKAPPQSHVNPASVSHTPAATVMRTLGRPEAVTTPMAVVPKVKQPHVGRPPVPKKPKANDTNKRDMTFEEKQRLSTNLQNMPAEKLDAIIQIIKKRSTALSQHDDEIEVDIDNVDTETLWELDRFVSNYKKNLSKNKRKAELALQARSVANQTVGPMNKTIAVDDAGTERGAALENSTSLLAVEGEQGYNGRSSSSSSSGSDSGSSSSDSNSDSSSENGSDAGHSPGK